MSRQYYGAAKEGLVPPHVGILTVLNAGATYTQLTLGEELGINKATMVRMLDVLEDKKLIRRESSSSDRRANFISLTPEGKRLFARVEKERLALEQSFFSELSDRERKQFQQLLLKLGRLNAVT